MSAPPVTKVVSDTKDKGDWATPAKVNVKMVKTDKKRFMTEILKIWNLNKYTIMPLKVPKFLGQD